MDPYTYDSLNAEPVPDPTYTRSRPTSYTQSYAPAPTDSTNPLQTTSPLYSVTANMESQPGYWDWYNQILFNQTTLPFDQWSAQRVQTQPTDSYGGFENPYSTLTGYDAILQDYQSNPYGGGAPQLQYQQTYMPGFEDPITVPMLDSRLALDQYLSSGPFSTNAAKAAMGQVQQPDGSWAYPGGTGFNTLDTAMMYSSLYPNTPEAQGDYVTKLAEQLGFTGTLGLTSPATGAFQPYNQAAPYTGPQPGPATPISLPSNYQAPTTQPSIYSTLQQSQPTTPTTNPTTGTSTQPLDMNSILSYLGLLGMFGINPMQQISGYGVQTTPLGYTQWAPQYSQSPFNTQDLLSLYMLSGLAGRNAGGYQPFWMF